MRKRITLGEPFGIIAGVAGMDETVFPAGAGSLVTAAGLSTSGPRQDASAAPAATAASMYFIACLMGGPAPTLAFLSIDPTYCSSFATAGTRGLGAPARRLTPLQIRGKFCYNYARCS